jgi:hypothetical protein
LIHRCILDNGKVFTARFGRGAGPVLFDRLCAEHGVRHLLTAPRSPTTTGKVERFHKTLRAEFLAGRVFASLDEAQAALDAWVASYNAERPHQGIGMACPGERFAPRAPEPAASASVLAELGAPPPERHRRRVSREGRLNFADQRYQVGAHFAGETVEVACAGELLEVSHRGVLVASLARREHVKATPAKIRPPQSRPRATAAPCCAR